MAKGFFTQGIVILLSDPVTVNALHEALADAYIVKGERNANDNWEFSGPSVTVEYRPEINGYVAIDIAPRPWPDHMGSAKEEPVLFATWGMGHFGPLTYPNGLQRAIQQSWRWKDATEAVSRHTCFLRIRLSYVFGAGKDAPVIPLTNDPLDELNFITGIARRLLQLPQVVCYFNPNGEILLPTELLEASTDEARQERLPALNTWINIRLFNLEPDWILMDTVGNGQLDLVDHEAACPKGQFSPQDIDSSLRNTTYYMMQKGDVIKDGDTVDGPGDIRWQGHRFENGLSDPPRTVIRWLPTTARDVPRILLPSLKEQGGTQIIPHSSPATFGARIASWFRKSPK